MWPWPQAPGSGSGASAERSLLCRVDGFRCLADIVVATPGRLVDHVDQTPGFSLQHLRFLVGCPPTQGRPGPADASFTHRSPASSPAGHRRGRPDDRQHAPVLAPPGGGSGLPWGGCQGPLRSAPETAAPGRDRCQVLVPSSALPCPGGAPGPVCLGQEGGRPGPAAPQRLCPSSTCCPQMPLQKLLFSATLTQNPEKLQQLGLHQPWLFSTRPARGRPGDADEDADSGGKYTFPAGLSVSWVPGWGGWCPRLGPSQPHAVPPAPLCALPPARQALGRPAPDPAPGLLQDPLLHQLPGELPQVRLGVSSAGRAGGGGAGPGPGPPGFPPRLFLLVQAFGGVTVAEFSSRYGPGQRKGILKQFEQGKIQL